MGAFFGSAACDLGQGTVDGTAARDEGGFGGG
jgi:hypothetical protein